MPLGDLHTEGDLEQWLKLMLDRLGIRPPPGAPPLVTSLPANPTDGYVVDFLADAANGIVWRLRYRLASASPYKWECIGGSPLWGLATDTVTLGNGTYSLTTPSLALPRAGDYRVTWTGLFSNGTGSPATFWLTTSVGGDADAFLTASNTGWFTTITYDKPLTLAAGNLTPRARGNGPSMTVAQRSMFAMPMRVS